MHKVLGPVLQKVHFAPQVRHLRDGFNVMCDFPFSKFNFLAAVDNIYAQFAPVNRGLDSAHIMLQQLIRKYFRYARMTSLKFSKFNFSAAISNINAQFAAVSRGVYSAYFAFQQLLEGTSCVREWRY